MAITRRNAVRIVPIKVPDDELRLATAAAVQAPAGARLTYRGGPVIAAVDVFAIFWGHAWLTSPQSGLMASIEDFYRFIVSSAVLRELNEYSAGGTTIATGTYAGSAVLETSHRRTVSDATLRKRLKAEIANNPAFPKPSANTLFMFHLPSGVTAVAGKARSCASFCGYHDAIRKDILYGVLPSPDCTGCLNGMPVLDAITVAASHELCEAVTDPIPGQSWYDDANGEIGDICAWQTKKIGAYTVQLEWSNKANGCV
ncbi:MAG: hypothetical protein DLM53_03640 [Candidatus Eremiobacter antarcticus]|nr:hypothetical protein [Candidatus Eremiobacteraeota bacterium]MBC5807366.1 hypothetical protein [Candidatus Eremiobacteraeota bacterium]PZR63119.1 MAG: hypothetical protein DLM53_03640 [Candidatus Eremiobacter sp. RRmetagenome_bin22]